MNILQRFFINKSNVSTALDLLNEFCKDGFKRDFDILYFPDDNDKDFSSLSFDTDYLQLKFDHSTWVSNPDSTDSFISLKQDAINFLFNIPFGKEFILTDEFIFLVDSDLNNKELRFRQVIERLSK